MNVQQIRIIGLAFLLAAILSGCAAPYQRYGMAGVGYPAQSSDPIVRQCQQQLGPAPSITDQAITTVAGAALGAGANAAFNALVGGDVGRGAGLGGLIGSGAGGAIAAMEPARYQEALEWCIYEAHQAAAAEYANRPCETWVYEAQQNNGPLQRKKETRCFMRTY